MDSFKHLFDDDDPVPEDMLRNVEQKLKGSANRVRFVGETTDLYVGKVGKTLVAFFGGGSPPKHHRNYAAPPVDNNAPPGGNN